MVMPPTGPSWESPPPPPPPPMAAMPYPAVYPTPSAPVQFRSLRGLAIAIYVLLPIAGLLALAMIPVAFHARSVVHDHASGNTVLVTQSVKDAGDAVGGVAGFNILVGLAIAVLFIIWMWRAASNLALFGRVRPKFGPGFAIGGWFIPFANFIIPGMQMFDIDKGSGPRLRSGERAHGSGLVVCWWIVFVLGRMFGMLAPQFELYHLYDVDGFDVLNVLLIIGSAATAVASVAAILVIRKITTAQEEGLADLGRATGFGAPQPPTSQPPVAPYPPVAASPPAPQFPAAPPAPAPPAPPATGTQWPGPPPPVAESDPE
ncbi:MAG: DUF4328 domain-containing protein [Acidimicrobiia bacterium]|nr:DUF4328 domain-containing protein [Acidimicrobiia bacterium]